MAAYTNYYLESVLQHLDCGNSVTFNIRLAGGLFDDLSLHPVCRLSLDDRVTILSLAMSTRRNGISRHQRVESSRGEGPNWILIAGGALLSTLSIRFGYKLKQSIDSKPHSNDTGGIKCTYRSLLLTCPGIQLYFLSYWKVVVQPMEHLTEEDL